MGSRYTVTLKAVFRECRALDLKNDIDLTFKYTPRYSVFLISHGRLFHNVSQTLGPRPQTARFSDLFSLFLVTKSLPDLLLILAIITSPILVVPFPVVFTVLSSVISDVFLVLLTIGSLAAREPFPVVFIPTSYDVN